MTNAQPYGRLQFREVLGRRMAYIDEGQGNAIVFQHGNEERQAGAGGHPGAARVDLVTGEPRRTPGGCSCGLTSGV